MQHDYGTEYARLYGEHWWWRARESILVDALRALALPRALEILDVGCGDGVFFPRLEEFGRVRGIEVDEGLLRGDGPYRDRISTLPLGDPMYAAEDWRFDLITALDVIEHIADDRTAVSAMAGMLRPGGVLLLTVPAFGVLWDHHDEINHHHRRYTAGRLRSVLAGHGLEPIRVRYLFRALFAPKLLVKLLNLGRKRKVVQHTIPSGPVNALMERICVREERLFGRWPIPFGTSVLALARRPCHATSRVPLDPAASSTHS